jgi:mono/diheme cytochrome c family protein
MATFIRSMLGFVGLALGLAAMGCSKSGDGPTGPAGPPGMQGPPPGPGLSAEEVLAKLPGGDDVAAGKKVYANSNCANCHKLGESGSRPGGPGGGPPGRGGRGPGGPDLTSVGAEAEHTKQWIADHIRNPKTHKQQSRMPAYGPEKITDADLAVLAEYLAGRK